MAGIKRNKFKGQTCSMRKTFTLLLLIALLGCKKEKPPEAFYFKAMLNNNAVQWIVPDFKNGSNLAYRTSTSFGYGDVNSNCSGGYCYYLSGYTMIFENNTEIKPQINIGFNVATQTGDKQEIRNLLAPGQKTYAPGIRTVQSLYDPALNGIVIYYIDQNGKDWCSNRGSQAGSSFESVSVTDETRSPVNQQFEKLWKARFSCKLYDNNGNFIDLKNGEILGAMLPK